jgi:non-heme chloroperoxidase
MVSKDRTILRSIFDSNITAIRLSSHKATLAATMPTFIVKDGTEIYYKDWGNKAGPVVVFSHGWPLNSDNWENQMFFLANEGYRVVAHDRRGHGRSSQPWEGNSDNMETWADDLAQLIEHLDLKGITLVVHSTG